MNSKDLEGFKTITVTTYKGAISGYSTEWWTEADWEKHRKYVEELKASGEYMKEEKITIHFKPFAPFDGNNI